MEEKLILMPLPFNEQIIHVDEKFIAQIKDDPLFIFPSKEKFNIENFEDVHISVQNIEIGDFDIVKKRIYEWDKLNEIQSLLNSGYYKPALTLALLLPDVCAKIAYPNDIRKTGDNETGNYERWFDESIYKYEIGEHGKEHKNFDCFNGKMCYTLRCKLVHGDTKDIESLVNHKKSTFIKDDQYKYVFFQMSNYDKSILITMETDKKEKYAFILHSIPKLVVSILNMADALYRETNDKTLFYDGCEVYDMSSNMLIRCPGTNFWMRK